MTSNDSVTAAEEDVRACCTALRLALSRLRAAQARTGYEPVPQVEVGADRQSTRSAVARVFRRDEEC